MRRLGFVLGVLSPILVSLSFSKEMPVTPSDQRCENNPAPVTEMGERKHLSQPVAADGTITPVVANGASYIRLQVRVENSQTNVTGCNWILTIRDEKYRLMQTLSAQDFLRSTTRWTNRVPGSKVMLDLQRCQQPMPSISIEEYIVMPDKAKQPYYSSKDPLNPRYQGLYEEKDPNKGPADTKFRPFGDYVGFLMGSWGTEPNRLSWCCSGVVVAPDLFLTNWHCGGPGKLLKDGAWEVFPEALYWNSVIVNDTVIDLSWDGDSTSREFICTKVEACNPELDFALLRIEPVTPLGSVRPVPICVDPLTANQAIYVVHHPECMQKQITTKECRIVDPERKGWRNDASVDFTHSCDTEGGSSGAPVFNAKNQLIGIHHLGYAFGPPPGCKQIDQLNKSVRIDKIIEYLRETKPELANALLSRH